MGLAPHPHPTSPIEWGGDARNFEMVSKRRSSFLAGVSRGMSEPSRSLEGGIFCRMDKAEKAFGSSQIDA
jgi:hypothetical protein